MCISVSTRCDADREIKWNKSDNDLNPVSIMLVDNMTCTESHQEQAKGFQKIQYK